MDVGLQTHTKIIVVSVSAFVVSSGFLFILSVVLCCCFHKKRDKCLAMYETTCAPEKEASPLYEEIQQQCRCHKHNLEMTNNLAYATIKM